LKRTLLLIFQFLILLRIFTQELDLSESHEEILKNILKMNIIVRLYQNQEKPLWDIQRSKLTIPGKAVILKIEGKDIKIYGNFTPYLGKENLSLLAQTQVILFPPIVPVLRYFISAKILLITLNESILFYPLGQKKDTAAADELEMEIELQLTPYNATAEAENNPQTEAVVP